MKTKIKTAEALVTAMLAAAGRTGLKGADAATADDFRLLDVAGQIDNYTERLVEASRSLSEDCARFAQRVEEAGFHRSTDCPTTSSLPADVVRYSAQLSVLWPLFSSMFVMVSGGKRVDDFVGATKTGVLS